MELENSAFQNITADVLMLMDFIVLAERLEISCKGMLLLVRGSSHQAICPLGENFGSMDVWELNPKWLGSLWLKASATGGCKSLWLKTTMTGPCPF